MIDKRFDILGPTLRAELEDMYWTFWQARSKDIEGVYFEVTCGKEGVDVYHNFQANGFDTAFGL